MSAKKKARGTRFSSAMSDALVREYRKHQFVLQGKFSGTVTNEKKKEAWVRTADAVNAVNQGERKTPDQVKKRWENMAGTVKKKKREARNKELKRLKVTGNGHLEDQDGSVDLSTPCTETFNPLEKDIAVILGPQSFTGILGGYDSMEILEQSSKDQDSEDENETISEGSSSCPAVASTVCTPVLKNQIRGNITSRKRPAAKSLAQAQLEYFEAATTYYKLKNENLN